MEWVGIVTARKSKVIPAPFQGRVNQVLVHASQVVKEGDVLAKFDDGELKRKLKGAVADQKASSAAGGRYAAEARAASHELAMNQKLFNRGFAPRNDIMNARTKLDSAGAGGGEAAARAEQAEATVDDIKSKLSHADVKAPFDGVISVVKVKEGEVANGGAPVARVFDPSDLVVRFAVPASDKTPIHKDSRVELRFPNTDGPIWAVVETVDDELEPPINYRIVQADIDDAKLRPGELTMNSVGTVTLADRPATKGRSR